MGGEGMELRAEAEKKSAKGRIGKMQQGGSMSWR